jgi:uncharacterized membrane protein YfhO
MEEYGLIILAILVVGALITLAIYFNTEATREATDAFTQFTNNANSAINNTSTDGSSSTSTSPTATPK